MCAPAPGEALATDKVMPFGYISLLLCVFIVQVMSALCLYSATLCSWQVYSGCMCENNTEGIHCQRCQTGFNNIPWSPGTACERKEKAVCGM